jgi:hypothetical protein
MNTTDLEPFLQVHGQLCNTWVLSTHIIPFRPTSTLIILSQWLPRILPHHRLLHPSNRFRDHVLHPRTLHPWQPTRVGGRVCLALTQSKRPRSRRCHGPPRVAPQRPLRPARGAHCMHAAHGPSSRSICGRPEGFGTRGQGSAPGRGNDGCCVW